jgi:DNA invertase Pin-like site-specific DNA recombinase
MEIKKKAFGYLRVSGKSQVEGDGFDRQKDKISAYAAANGIHIVKWYEEQGVSGTLADRPALQEMMVAILSNGVRTFLVEKLDRLARDPMVQEHIIKDCRQQEIEVISVMEPDLCEDDPTRKLLRVIMGAISEYDKTMIVLKLKAARDRMRIKTGRCEGRKAFGASPEEQAAIRRMRELTAAGLNYTHVADTLNNEGFKTQTGSRWFPTTVSRTLARAAK